MMFLAVFNVVGHDIGPTTINTFWVSSLIMLVGFFIMSNLVGEFSNILNDIYASDTNNEIDENLEMIENIVHNMELPEALLDRIYEYLDPGTIKTEFIRTNKFHSLISKSQSYEVKHFFISECFQNLNLLNNYEFHLQLKFLIDNLDLRVYLEDDTIIKQGDMAGPNENVYFILEGSANVILEKNDFCHFNQESIDLFLNEYEEEFEEVNQKSQDNFIRQIIRRQYSEFILLNLQHEKRNRGVDVTEDIFMNIKAILREDVESLVRENSIGSKIFKSLNFKRLVS